MNIEGLEEELRHNTTCEVRFDSISRIAYSVDASIYEIEPIGIVLPKTKDDLLVVIKIARKRQIPLIPRGAATGITGGCLGKGLIVDTSKYLNKVIEINIEEKYAIVEPGVVQDRLNEILAPHGYRLGPDTSTGDRATLGGMVANNSAGARSLKYGKMVDNILATELCLSTGEIVTFEKIDAAQIEKIMQENRTWGQIYKTVLDLRDTHREEIKRVFPKIPRRVSGYNLDELITDGPLNLSKLIVGSEGTLGILTKIKVAIAPRPKETALCLIYFDDLIEAMHSIERMLSYPLLSLELIDPQIIARGRQAPSMIGKMGWLKKDPRALLVAEIEGDTKEGLRSTLTSFREMLANHSIGKTIQVVNDPKQMGYVWELRKAGLGLLLSKRSYSRAIAFIEDISIPPTKLAPFMEKFLAYVKSQGKEAGIYGHAGSGCMHIRPYIDLRDREELQKMKAIQLHVSDLLLEFGGALSGEHGDGLIRSWLNEKMFGKTIYAAFKELKQAFDPIHLMNPGKIVDGPPLEENLRLDPETPMVAVPTFLDFSKEGGFELAADLCNGNGRCRKKEGVMCPSFQATGEEYDTTRARAQSLRAIIHGRLPLEQLKEQELQQVLDLCIECKGCKTECPSNVDMAKMKAEVLYQYQEKQGYSLRNKFFGHIPSLLKIGSKLPSFMQRLTSTLLSKKILSWFGISPNRPLPSLANQTLSEWYKQNYKPSGSGKKVILFNDTYSEYTEPHIAIAAIKMLTSLNYDVLLPMWHCCGRPLYSKGMLNEAKTHSLKIIESLLPLLEPETKVIVLEPSCLSMFKEDYEGLLGSSEKTKLLRESACSFAQFLHGHLSLIPKIGVSKVFLHGHCHQKAMDDVHYITEVLKAAGCDVTEIASGCCGMAGSFGYEKEHYDLSIKIGELKLAPAIRNAPQDAIIVAEGISCRSQIAHLTGKRAFHLAELFRRSYQ